MTNIWVRKPLSVLLAEAEEPEVQALTAHGGVPLKRTLSAVNLVTLGIGAIIGAGIFVLTGHAAAANAGPAITLSFVLGGYRLRLRRPLLRRDGLDRPDRRQRLHLRLRDHGRVHRLDHRLGPDPRIRGRRHDRRDRLVGLRGQLPRTISASPFPTRCCAASPLRLRRRRSDAWQLAPARSSTFRRCSSSSRVTALLVIGIHESASVNNVIVVIKVVDRRDLHRGRPRRSSTTAIGSLPPIRTARSSRRMPGSATFGWSGVLRGAGVVFFAYIGFDAVSTAAQEAKNPQRDMPIGILGSLVDLHDPLRAGRRRDDRHRQLRQAQRRPIRSRSASTRSA